jgi:UDP-N-acetylmuramoyl-L-alanyl-D-glutamate--2,6-diaminopimelate ligase
VELRHLVAALGSVRVEGDLSTSVFDILSDSRRVRPGDLFVSIPGRNHDGHQFIAEAVKRGAVAVVAQRDFDAPPDVARLIVANSRVALSALADTFFGYPSRQVSLVGVTGTNGKTTIAFLVKAIAEAAGRKSGVVGTAGMMVGEDVVEAKSGFTTPEAPAVHRLLREMVNRGAEVIGMEVTSHALDQHRVDHCRFAAACYSNLTHEHLDYHGDMEGYFEAKARLFRLLEPGATAVINLNDPFGRRFVNACPPGVRVWTYGENPEADLHPYEISLTATGASYRLRTPVGEAFVEAPYLFGNYNIANALAAIGACLGIGLPLEACVAGIRAAKGAPGRFEPVDLGQDFTVVVDYAHTPDGFEKLLSNVARTKPEGSRILMVFGSAGHRDRTKRPDMGRVAAAYCDVLVLTEEDPRTEDAMQIAREIASGVDREGVEVHLIEDRAEAINAAISLARPNDIVLITGKGNETDLEVQHATTWKGDVPAATEALRRLLQDPSRRKETA